MTITVNPVPDPPVANDDAYTTDEDTPHGGYADVLVNDTDLTAIAERSTRLTDRRKWRHGDLRPCDETPMDSCTYTPNDDFSGTDTFTYDAN